jgi:transcriptional regulator with XRE-family HTH domain
MTGGDDQTDRFIDEGIWEHDFDDNSRVLAQVRTMQTGERIAIKAATRRKAGLIDSTEKTRRACYSRSVRQRWRLSPIAMPIQRLMSDEALLHEIGQRIARLRLERNLSQAQLAEQAGISKRTLERLEAGAAATQLSLFLRVLRQLDLLERLELLLPEPQPSPLALLEQQQQATRKRASRRRLTKPASSWSWGQP